MMGKRGHEFIIAAFVGIVTVGLQLPFRHFVPWIGDEGLLLRGAQDLLRGRIIYRDFFELHPPGGFLAVAMWITAFGSSLASVRALTITLAAGTAALTYLCCRRATRSTALAVGLSLAWVIVAQGGTAQLSHHAITTPLSLAAMLAAMVVPRDSRFGWAAGAAAGAATMVTQTRGVLAVLATAISLGGRRPALWRFGLGVAITPIVVLIYLIAVGGLQPAWADLVVWPATSYGSIQGFPYGTYTDTRTWLATATFPAAGVAAGLLLFSREARADHVFKTACSFALAGLIGSFPRPDAPYHLAINMPLALPLLVYGVDRLTGSWATRYQVMAAALSFCAFVPSMGVFTSAAVGLARSQPEATLAGPAVFMEQGVGELLQDVANIPKKDGVFFYPYMPLIPVLAGREQASSFDIFLPEYTTPAQYRQAIEQVLQRAQWMVYDRRWTDDRYLLKVFPTMHNADPVERQQFEAELAKNFEPVADRGRFVILQRRRPQ